MHSISTKHDKTLFFLFSLVLLHIMSVGHDFRLRYLITPKHGITRFGSPSLYLLHAVVFCRHGFVAIILGVLRAHLSRKPREAVAGDSFKAYSWRRRRPPTKNERQVYKQYPPLQLASPPRRQNARVVNWTKNRGSTARNCRSPVCLSCMGTHDTTAVLLTARAMGDNANMGAAVHSPSCFEQAVVVVFYPGPPG